MGEKFSQGISQLLGRPVHMSSTRLAGALVVHETMGMAWLAGAWFACYRWEVSASKFSLTLWVCVLDSE